MAEEPEKLAPSDALDSDVLSDESLDKVVGGLMSNPFAPPLPQ